MMWEIADNWRLFHALFGWHFVHIGPEKTYTEGTVGIGIPPEYSNPSVRLVVFEGGKPLFTYRGERRELTKDDDHFAGRFRPLTFSFDENGKPVARKGRIKLRLP